jgi:hypothetical protein
MPDNAGFMHAAYGVAAAVYTLYALSLWRRGRAVRRDLQRNDARSLNGAP